MKKKLLIIVLAVSLVLNAVAATVFAMTDGEEIINAILNKNIRMIWNDEEFEPVDPVNNERVYPIVYNDRTYIPARFIAEKAGIVVDWDDDTNTVLFNASGEVQAAREDAVDATSTSTSSHVATAASPAAYAGAPVPAQAENKIASFGGTVQQFEGKIAIITNAIDQNEEEFYSAQMAVAKYGADKVIHRTWQEGSMFADGGMNAILASIAADPEIKAVIINQAIPGTNAAIDALRETRDDVFIVNCTPHENPIDASERSDLMLIRDELGMGYAMPTQAARMGAKVFVHYSFPRHMAHVLLSGCRDILKSECARLGLEFIDATAPDPTSDAGVIGAQRFILEDVPKKIAEYGKDTAFFATNCSMQIPLIKAVVDGGAIYPQPCCPSPLHGFPAALGIEGGVLDMEWVIAETSRIIKDKGVSGRISTWPVPASIAETYTGVEYAIKWINGEVPKEGLDLNVLKECMIEYTGVDVVFTAYQENGVTYDNFQMFLLGYLTYDGL